MKKIRDLFSRQLEPDRPRFLGVPFPFFIAAWVACLEIEMIMGAKVGLVVGPLILIGTFVSTRLADKARHR